MLQITLFLSIGLAILFGAHFFIYVSLVQFFTLTSASYRYFFATLLFFLSLSFIVASVASHYYENSFTRNSYFLSGLWLGLLVNLLLACLMGWMILWTNQWISLSLDRALLGSILLGLAVVVSAYGVWHALHPVVKQISVRIPGLPAEWKGKTIVQLSDVHLGHVYRSAFLQNVVEQVNSLQPKMVVITGDLFDGMDGHLDSLVRPLGDIDAPNGTFFVAGNHETYVGVDAALSALKDTRVTILKDEVRDIDGLRLIGINFPSRGEKKDFMMTLTSLRDQFSRKPNILLYHAPSNVEEAAQSGVNLMLSGHTHRGQQFPFQYITKKVHKGYDYGIYSLGNFTLYTTSGVGTWGPTMRIGTQSEIVAITLEE